MKRYKLLLTKKQIALISEACFEYGGVLEGGMLEGDKLNKKNEKHARDLDNLNYSIANQIEKQTKKEKGS